VHGHANWLMLLSLGQLVVNVPVNVFFIQKWGIEGAATATTLVFAAGTFVSWLLVRKAIGAWPLSRAVVQELRQGVLHRR
jgi:Na+-driven multidrug efflux pump